MVAYNANPVINIDADQIIVATAGTHSHGELPPINYVSGGLEGAGDAPTGLQHTRGRRRCLQEMRAPAAREARPVTDEPTTLMDRLRGV